MYKKFFGFKERPFQLVPNPAYLFLSKSHEEALAHLNYAVSQGDGFVEITGEVGTGKTTLCRVFLGSLGEDTEAAYIFNPLLNAVQLLKAINEEFGIDSRGETSKELIDTLNLFLMEKKRRGKQVLVLIDEAQKLSGDVLEQLRLLSNLETDTSKLLQIILVGQPELREMLDSRELRQLGQRITLSCHLTPLDFRETRAYIRHRIQIASQKPGVKFTRLAFWSIYRYSGGIPRLINISSDRALLAAYGLNRRKITGPIAKSAIRELASRGENRRFARFDMRSAFVMLLLMAVGLSLFGYASGIFKSSLQGTSALSREVPLPARVEPPPSSGPVPSEAIPEVSAPAGIEAAFPVPEPAELKTELSPPPEIAAAPVSSPEPSTDQTAVGAIRPDESPTLVKAEDIDSVPIHPMKIADLMQASEDKHSRRSAIESVMRLWQPDVILKAYLDDMGSPDDFFRLAARQNAFSILRVEADLALIQKLDLPAILQLTSSDTAGFVFLPVTGTGDGSFILKGEGENRVSATPSELIPYWTGIAYIPWKNFYGLTGIIPRSAPEDTIISLKMLLRDIGFREIDLTPTYDPKTLQAVEYIQEKHEVPVDGSVGPLTKIILYNELDSLRIPRLSTRNTTRSGEEIAN